MKIQTAHLTRVYQVGNSAITAVNEADLEVNEATLVAIVGPSGSGKSTLLNLIGLNDHPTSGKIFFDDKDTSLLSSRERRKTRLNCIGFVFQTFNLLPTLNALENVELPMALAGKHKKEQREKAIQLLNTVGLKDRFFHRPKELSMGEMQRVAIARALANDAEVLIADEPTGELDSKIAKEIVSLLYDLREERDTAVIVATHDEKIVQAADVIYHIHDGKLKSES
jgi:putative ABC transport system ATP-binding protein